MLKNSINRFYNYEKYPAANSGVSTFPKSPRNTAITPNVMAAVLAYPSPDIPATKE